MKPVIVLAYDGEFDVAPRHRGARPPARGAGGDVDGRHRAGATTSGPRATSRWPPAPCAPTCSMRATISSRQCVLPALRAAPDAGLVLASKAALAYPVIAPGWLDVARIEGTRMVAHGGPARARVPRSGHSMPRCRCSRHRRHAARGLASAAAPPVRRPRRGTCCSGRSQIRRRLAVMAANVEIEFDESCRWQSMA